MWLDNASKNNQIRLEECQSIYWRMAFTWVWQQSDKVNTLSEGWDFAKPTRMKTLFYHSSLSIFSFHCSLQLMHRQGQAPGPDLQWLQQWCCDRTERSSTAIQSISTDCACLGPSIVKHWFMSAEVNAVSKVRQHTAPNINGSMEHYCVRAQERHCVGRVGGHASHLLMEPSRGCRKITILCRTSLPLPSTRSSTAGTAQDTKHSPSLPTAPHHGDWPCLQLLAFPVWLNRDSSDLLCLECSLLSPTFNSIFTQKFVSWKSVSELCSCSMLSDLLKRAIKTS